MIVFEIGAFFFGALIGWITYRTLRRKPKVELKDIATVIGALGGGVVVRLFNDPNSFGTYAIGLFVGFFGYLAFGWWKFGAKELGVWMRLAPENPTVTDDKLPRKANDKEGAWMDRPPETRPP